MIQITVPSHIFVGGKKQNGLAVLALNKHLPNGYRAHPRDVGSVHNWCRIVILKEENLVILSEWGEEIPQEVAEATEKADWEF